MWVPFCVVTATKPGVGPAAETWSLGQVGSREHRLELACNSLRWSPPIFKGGAFWDITILPQLSDAPPCRILHVLAFGWILAAGGGECHKEYQAYFSNFPSCPSLVINSQGPLSCVWIIAATSHLSLCFQSPSILKSIWVLPFPSCCYSEIYAVSCPNYVIVIYWELFIEKTWKFSVGSRSFILQKYLYESVLKHWNFSSLFHL